MPLTHTTKTQVERENRMLLALQSAGCAAIAVIVGQQTTDIIQAIRTTNLFVVKNPCCLYGLKITTRKRGDYALSFPKRP